MPISPFGTYLIQINTKTIYWDGDEEKEENYTWDIKYPCTIIYQGNSLAP